MDSKSLGLAGEKAAERYLKKNGYRIRARRWWCPKGEIDLIARKGNEVVFVEVKTRTSESFGGALAAVDFRKAARLRAATYTYLNNKSLWGADFRIDVITVTVLPGAKSARLEHHVNAIGED
jgi:putative endonuclease